jgi:hypothetical protein
MLRVYLPAPKSLISQRFGDNANYSYSRDGLKGHTSYDWGMPWGAPIPNCVANAYCYSNMHLNDPILMDYRAVFFICESDDGKVYEVSYGHLSKHATVVGKTYQVGETIGYVGNTGDCFAGAHEVTEAEKRAGSHAGAHLHGPQLRPVKRVTRRTKSAGWYLQDANGFLKINGFFFEILNYTNGYNGCVSLAPFSTETLASTYQAPVAPVTPSAPILDQKTVSELHDVADAIGTLPEANQPYFLGILQSILKAFGIR